MSGHDWSTGPIADDAQWVRVEETSAVGGVRRRAVEMAERLGFPTLRVDQVALASSEAASNLYKHASAGVIVLRTIRDARGGAVELISIDSGPGIPDIELSMRDGYSTRGTLGVGLGAISRLSGVCDLYSVQGQGTVLVARFRAQEDAEQAAWQGGITRPLGGEDACGDAFAACADGEIFYGMLCDGLGHGPLAANAAQEALRVLRGIELPAAPAEILERVHRGIGHTRGAAVSVVRVDLSTRQVRFAGLGNVSGWIVGPDGRQGMISVPGIAGHQARTFREYGYELPEGAAIVLHTDGLTDRWDLSSYPGLLTRAPLLIAATLLRDKGVRRDDGGILAMKPA